MKRLQEQLPAMFALAHDRSDEARVELASRLSDVFLSDAATFGLREEELVNELIELLLRSPSPAVRECLVHKFANLAAMPRTIAVRLATGEIDSARPVLMNAKSLTDEDLVSVVKNQSHGHAEAIAHRAAISEAVADALVLTGDIKVMQAVAENLGASLNQRAVEVLVDAARFSHGLREPVMKRPEINHDSAVKLYWWISQDLRRYALKRFNIASGQIDKALAKTVDELLAYHQLDKGNDEVMGQIADWLMERDAVSVKLLPQVLRLGYFRLFNILLSRLTKLDLALINNIVDENGGRSLAACCRAIGADKPGFVSIFLLSRGARHGEQTVHPRELSHALAAFDRLSPSLAQDMMHSWKVDPSYLQQLHNDFALEA